MGFVNGEVMIWEELTDFLIPINRKLGNGLHLNLATCFSMHVAESIILKNASPYKSLTSIIDKITAGEILTDNLKFYAEIFKSGNIYDSYVQFLQKKPNTKFNIKDIETVLNYIVKFQIQRFVETIDLGMVKMFFDNYLNIDIDIEYLKIVDNKSDYILNKFMNRFLFR